MTRSVKGAKAASYIVGTAFWLLFLLGRKRRHAKLTRGHTEHEVHDNSTMRRLEDQDQSISNVAPRANLHCLIREHGLAPGQLQLPCTNRGVGPIGEIKRVEEEGFYEKKERPAKSAIGLDNRSDPIVRTWDVMQRASTIITGNRASY